LNHFAIIFSSIFYIFSTENSQIFPPKMQFYRFVASYLFKLKRIIPQSLGTVVFAPPGFLVYVSRTLRMLLILFLPSKLIMSFILCRLPWFLRGGSNNATKIMSRCHQRFKKTFTELWNRFLQHNNKNTFVLILPPNSISD
jgi:hypothetical protein